MKNAKQKRPLAPKVKEQLAAGYEASAERSLRLAAEWFPLEEEAWHKAKPSSPATKKRKR